jgi:hypothetical protein
MDENPDIICPDLLPGYNFLVAASKTETAFWWHRAKLGEHFGGTEQNSKSTVFAPFTTSRASPPSPYSVQTQGCPAELSDGGFARPEQNLPKFSEATFHYHDLRQICTNSTPTMPFTESRRSNYDLCVLEDCHEITYLTSPSRRCLHDFSHCHDPLLSQTTAAEVENSKTCQHSNQMKAKRI